MVIIDAWMQHPSAEFPADPAFLHASAERVFGLAAGPGPGPQAATARAAQATTERAQA